MIFFLLLLVKFKKGASLTARTNAFARINGNVGERILTALYTATNTGASASTIKNAILTSGSATTS